MTITPHKIKTLNHVNYPEYDGRRLFVVAQLYLSDLLLRDHRSCRAKVGSIYNAEHFHFKKPSPTLSMNHSSQTACADLRIINNIVEYFGKLLPSQGWPCPRESTVKMCTNGNFFFRSCFCFSLNKLYRQISCRFSKETSKIDGFVETSCLSSGDSRFAERSFVEVIIKLPFAKITIFSIASNIFVLILSGRSFQQNF